ncbi:MAG: sigma-54-dependent transcriptional regulator [Bdellovibrio sp.]
MKDNQNVKVLIIDDQAASRLIAQMMLEKLFDKISSGKLYVQEAATLNQGLQTLQDENFHIVLLDKDLGKDHDGNEIKGTDHIQDILSIRPLTQVLVMTADSDPKEIAQAIRAGAADYLFKGNDIGMAEYREAVVLKNLDRAKKELEEATKNLHPIDTSLYGEFISVSPIMQRLQRQVEAYAESQRPVLILGDTGLGKGAVARLLNKYRAKYLGQKERLFLNLNVGSLSDEMAQSELFGHEANAFTGAARKTKLGFLEIGSDGDIFLDEIGDASPSIQLKLLKVLEEKEYMRLGGTRTLKTNARFIFATNKDLNELVKKGKFRQDLLARISLTVDMPKLEDRKEDLPDLIKLAIERVNDENKFRKLSYATFPKDLIEYLCRDNIEGNIRGIENDILRLSLGGIKQKNGFVDVSQWRNILTVKASSKTRTDNAINFEILQQNPTNFLSGNFPGLKKTREVLERKILEEASRKYSSLAEIAKALKITKPAVHQKLKVEKIKIKKQRKSVR